MISKVKEHRSKALACCSFYFPGLFHSNIYRNCTGNFYGLLPKAHIFKNISEKFSPHTEKIILNWNSWSSFYLPELKKLPRFFTILIIWNKIFVAWKDLTLILENLHNLFTNFLPGRCSRLKRFQMRS